MRNKRLQKLFPCIGIIGSICLILPSIVSIYKSPYDLNSDHILLIAGICFMIICIKEIYDEMK